jgi:transposase
MIFVGDDWAEDHHDVYLMDEAGRRLGSRRLPEGLIGIRQLHELIAAHAEEPEQVVLGIETDRGLWVGALTAAGYRVFAINPLAVARYRDRHHVSGAKSDASDAKLLADLVRTDRHNHRSVAGDSADAEAIKVLARAHQSLIWSRTRHTNALRSALREYYPTAVVAFEDLADGDALGVLHRVPTPDQGARVPLTAIQAGLKRGGRKRNIAVLARHVRNRRLYDAIDQWAFCTLTVSPGARAFYDQHRAAKQTHHQALRALGNRLVGILHGCLRHQATYDEHTAWAHRMAAA